MDWNLFAYTNNGINLVMCPDGYCLYSTDLKLGYGVPFFWWAET